jgi:hypothetical protein
MSIRGNVGRWRWLGQGREAPPTDVGAFNVHPSRTRLGETDQSNRSDQSDQIKVGSSGTRLGNAQEPPRTDGDGIH